jgi:hypothetical protein
MQLEAKFNELVTFSRDERSLRGRWIPREREKSVHSSEGEVRLNASTALHFATICNEY